VNGKYEGKRLWHPFRVDVANLLVPGENEVEVGVTNTMENTLGRPITPSGIKDAKPVPYNVHVFKIGKGWTGRTPTPQITLLYYPFSLAINHLA